MELRAALLEGGLTTLRLLRTGGEANVTLLREWDPELDFSGYASSFQVDHVASARPLALAGDAARAWLAERDAGAALVELERMMADGEHEMVELFCHAALGIGVTHHVHSSTLGANNGFHALRAGGLRRHEPSTPERDVLADGLNLSRAMSYKCAAAGLPFGGSKTTAVCEPFSLDDGARLGFLGYTIDRGHLITGPDMGFVPELIDAIAARYSRHILCGPGGPLGHTGAPTAYGVFCAMQAAAEHAFGSPSLEYRTVAVQGVGAVGLELAKLLAGARAKIVIADRDPARLTAAQHEVGGMRVVAPDAIIGVECDVFAPCAVGGVLDTENIERLSAALVFGSANNQLAASTLEGEVALARRLAERGICFVPDWTYTMGGILAGYEEYVYRERASAERLDAAIERAAGEGVRGLLAAARSEGRTPTEIAYQRYRGVVHPRLGDGGH